VIRDILRDILAGLLIGLAVLAVTWAATRWHHDPGVIYFAPRHYHPHHVIHQIRWTRQYGH